MARIERDSMGEVSVPDEAYWAAQTQRAVDNFPISGLRLERRMIWALATIKGAAATVNERLGLLDPELAKAIARGGGRGGRRTPRRPLPGRRLPDRLGHLVQHEHQRGPGQPGQGDPGRGPQLQAGPPQRPRQCLPVLQRRVPLGHPPRRLRRLHRGAGPRPGRAGRGPGGQGGRVRPGGEGRPYPPDGRHPRHPGPGVRRLGGGGAPRDRAGRGDLSAAGRDSPRGHGRGHGHQRPARLRPRRHRAHPPGQPGPPGPPGGPRPFRGPGGTRRAGGGQRGAAHRGRVALQDQQRHPLAVVRVRGRAWPRSGSPTSSRAARSCPAR